MSMHARGMGLSLILMLACCGSNERQTIEVVPRPIDSAEHFDAAFSTLMGRAIVAEVASRGYAAILDGARGKPDSCKLIDEPSGDAQLTLYAWVQQVELTPHAPDGDPRVFGGLVLLDGDGQQLGSSSGTTSAPGEPSNDLYEVASPIDPRAVQAAERFGPWMLGSIRDFADKVGPYLK
jgi:hypothetical protein